MKIRIGTRKSKLALAQTYIVRDMIKDAFPEAEIELVEISTKGDEILDRSLTSFGGKGVFTKELEEALLRGETDLAVHSAKDMPMEFPEGLVLGAVVERADVRDAVITTSGVKLADLPSGSVVGTSSLRRELQIKEINPTVKTKLLRGNVQTRIRKLKEGQYDAILLAAAGLSRLGLECEDGIEIEYLDPDVFIPAAGQGILAVEARKGDLTEVLAALNCQEAALMLSAERSFLAAIGGSCNAPAAGLCVIRDGKAQMKVLYAPEGADMRKAGGEIALSENGDGEKNDVTDGEGSFAAMEKMQILGASLASKVKQGRVYLLGAGPGDAGLLTQKALEVIRTADVLVYDSLSTPAVLNEAKREAELIYAGKRADKHHLRQWETNALLVEKALEGKTVARVKGGDPFIFGRGGEEAQELKKAGVEFEIVPGVSSAYAAPAYAGIPVTHRDFASSFHVITGHESETKEETVLDYDTLAREEGTLVFLMGLKNLPFISQELIAHGKNPHTPAAVVQQGTTARQRIAVGELENIADTARMNGIRTPALTVVGDVVGLQKELDWIRRDPLCGVRVLLTGTPSMCEKQLVVMKAAGAEVIPFSLVYTEDLSEGALDPVMDEIGSYTWVVLTSSNGVEFFLKELHKRRIDIRKLSGLYFAVIGEGTKLALESAGIYADFVPSKYSSAVLAKEWIPTLGERDRVLMLRAQEASAELSHALDEAGIGHTDAALYRTARDYRKAEELNRLVNEVDYITLASASAVHAFADMVEDVDAMSAKVISIGPVTERAAIADGVPVYASASVYTAEGMCDAIRKDRLGK